MFFAFFHECGHLFAGVALGFKPESLSINPMGLSIKFRINPLDYNKKVHKANILALKRIIIALAGPMVNFIIAIIFCLININNLKIDYKFIIYSNLLIGLFNLIPIYPLDGGRILKNIIHIFRGLDESHIYMNTISNACVIILTVFSSIGILYLKNIAILFITVYLWYLVINQNKLYNQRIQIYEILNKINTKEDDEKIYINLK